MEDMTRLDGFQIHPWEGAILGIGAPVVKYRDFLPCAVQNGRTDRIAICVLRTRVSRRMHKFNRISHVAQICPTTLFRELCKNG